MPDSGTGGPEMSRKTKAGATQGVAAMGDLDAPLDTEVSLVELAVSHWMYWMQFASEDRNTFQKILVPIDRTKESQGVIHQADNLLRSEGEGILLHVIPDTATASAQEGSNSRGFDRRDGQRLEALEYLAGVVARLGEGSIRWRCDVVVAPSVADAVIGYAAREHVDIIVMNSHDRKGLAKLTKRSIAKEIQKRAPVQVRVFRSRELALS